MCLIHSNSIRQILLRAEFGCFSDLTCSLELSNVQFLHVLESIEFDVIESQCDEFQILAYGIVKTLGHETQAQATPPVGRRGLCILLFHSWSTASVHRQRCAHASALALFQFVVPHS